MKTVKIELTEQEAEQTGYALETREQQFDDAISGAVGHVKEGHIEKLRQIQEAQKKINDAIRKG
jgi:hypothetical protein